MSNATLLQMAQAEHDIARQEIMQIAISNGYEYECSYCHKKILIDEIVVTYECGTEVIACFDCFVNHRT